MTTFLALYRGSTVAEAQIVAVSADPALVRDVATYLLGEPEPHEGDAVVRELESGRRNALRLLVGDGAEG